jgi:glycerol-3-phosphate dehydrogenase (NAD(P)+)
MIGAGKIGSAIGKVLLSNKVEVDFWDALPGKVKRQKPLEKIVPGADAVFLCLPSWCLRDAGTSIAPFISPKTSVVSVSKGLEKDTFLASDGVLHQVLPEGTSFVFLGGPLLADELLAGQPGIGVAASADPSALKKMKRLFVGTILHIETSDDVAGVVWSAVLKNIYAIGLGMTEGLGWGANARGWFVAKAVEEAGGILEDLGGRRETFHGTAGVGDMVATGFSPHSKNRTLGLIGRRTERLRSSEGQVSLPRPGSSRSARRQVSSAHGSQGYTTGEEESSRGFRQAFVNVFRHVIRERRALRCSPYRKVWCEHAHRPIFPTARGPSVRWSA